MRLMIGLILSIFAGYLFGNDESLRFKIGQMFIIGCSEREWDEGSVLAENIRKYQPGGIVLYNYEYSKDTNEISSRNIVCPEQLTKLTTNLHDYWSKVAYKGEGTPTLPLIIAVDEEGGAINRLPRAQGFEMFSVSAQALGCYNKPDYTYQYAGQVAACLKSHHLNTNFAPVVDVNINPINPIIGGRGRSFSSNPAIVIQQAQMFIKAHKEKHALTALKHYPGHGSSTMDTHEGYVDVTKTWQKGELLPFKTLVKNGYDEIVMTAHVVNGRLDSTKIKNKDGKETLMPMTFSKKMITKVLKNKWKFKGVVMTDDLSMGAIANHHTLDQALLHALEAGVDMFILSNNHQKNETPNAVESVYQLVKSGKISEARINESFNRIVQLKSKI